MPVVDFQPIVDAGAFYLYTIAITNLMGPVFLTVFFIALGYGFYRFIRAKEQAK